MKQRKETDPIQPGSIVSPKLDGIFVEASKSGIATKSGKPVENRPDLRRRLGLHFLLHPKSKIRGELYQHGQPFEDTLSDFKAGKKLPLHIHPDTAGPKPLPVLGIRRIRARKVNSQAAADADYKASLAKGYEGQIVQSPDGTVEKRKPMKDAEFRITGKARGKAHGILTVATADKQPFRVQVHPDKISEPGIIGKHATIAFPRKSKRGIPQQPVFKSVRDYSALMPGMIQVGSLT